MMQIKEMDYDQNSLTFRAKKGKTNELKLATVCVCGNCFMLELSVDNICSNAINAYSKYFAYYVK